ncbi:hypothetical protein Kpho02_72900 [Kitasatospora phosalacinea]|uniref:Uncharacterized protein n=1 Tax=Kitasatospora phosalacinea TaxID=2065 RepID=A0A9W6QHM5_9ACTN|nr:hypothetical protein [Kitasatospora phosalacinea]GLW74993.1 hypothetical protein Kpho02_72900 [Kitasatospora phosalacinea]
MSTHRYRAGERAVIARPEPSTPHRPGTPVEVLHVPAAAPVAEYVLQVITDGGDVASVWSGELDPVVAR